MKNKILLISAVVSFASCKMLSNSNNKYADDKKYSLQLNPKLNSNYYYDITNASNVTVQADGKEINNKTKTTVGVQYNITKDSAGNFIMGMTYDKIQLYTKKGDAESSYDAANAAASIDPVEKMLGTLKNANIKAVVTPAGDMKSITGYQELNNQLIASLETSTFQEVEQVQSQWQRFIEEGLVKKNVDQLFKIFPDSAVRVGEKWKLTVKEAGELGLNVQNFYKLIEITDGVAIIESDGELSTGNSDVKLMGPGSSIDVSGKQRSRYELDMETGMLITSTITSKGEGMVKVMGKEIPLTIESEVKMIGRRVK